MESERMQEYSFFKKEAERLKKNLSSLVRENEKIKRKIRELTEEIKNSQKIRDDRASGEGLRQRMSADILAKENEIRNLQQEIFALAERGEKLLETMMRLVLTDAMFDEWMQYAAQDENTPQA